MIIKITSLFDIILVRLHRSSKAGAAFMLVLNSLYNKLFIFFFSSFPLYKRSSML